MAHVHEPELDRQGKALGRSGSRFTVTGLVLALPGIALLAIGLAVGTTALWVLGVVLLAVASWPVVVGGALLLSSGVSRWHARHRPFA